MLLEYNRPESIGTVFLPYLYFLLFLEPIKVQVLEELLGAGVPLEHRLTEQADEADGAASLPVLCWHGSSIARKCNFAARWMLVLAAQGGMPGNRLLRHDN